MKSLIKTSKRSNKHIASEGSVLVVDDMPEERLIESSVSELLEEVGLKSEERKITIRYFAPSDYANEALWTSLNVAAPPRFVRPPETVPDSILCANDSRFFILLRDDLPSPDGNFLIKHCVGHIAHGHIRLGDNFAHWDFVSQLRNGRPARRWDAQVAQFFKTSEPVITESFRTEGLGEVLTRLQTRETNAKWMSAALLYGTYRNEVVEVPRNLAEMAQLFPHQTRGIAETVARLRRFNASVLADSVGLGKTRTTCAAIRVLRDNNGVGHSGRRATAVILTPRKLERNWRKELSVVGLLEGRDVIFVNKDIFKRFSAQEAARAVSGVGLIVVEEAHQDLRNPGSRFHRNLRASVGTTPGLLVTATPWNNRRGDIFSILSPFVRPVPGVADGAFECFRRGFRTGRKEFEESDEVFHRVYTSTVLQRTRRQLREMGDAGVFYAPRDPKLEVVPYKDSQQAAFRTLLDVVEALRLPYFNPIRYLTAENDAEWRLSGTYRFFLLKRAESSMAALRLTLKGMRERAEKLHAELDEVKNTEIDIARWLAGCYKISDDIVEDVLDSSREGILIEDRVARPRQKRALRLIEEARLKGRLRPLRRQLMADCDRDVKLLNKVEKEFASLFDADPKLPVVRESVRRAIAAGQKVLLVSQFADTAFTVYKMLLGDEEMSRAGIGLVMSTAKGNEPPVQAEGKRAKRDEVIRRFAPLAWARNEIESGHTSPTGLLAGERELAILVGTDTLSVGQNLQDARVLLHLDLTWNPMVLEQRIGRLDRPRHESDNEPIQTRYFLNLDLIEAELKLKKTIDARLQATYQDTAFDDEILPGYFELIEKMRHLRQSRATASDIAREVEAMLEELAVARPPDIVDTDVESRRMALDRLREEVSEHALPEPVPPLTLTLETSDETDGKAELAAQIELQSFDNNGVEISRPTEHLLVVQTSLDKVEDAVTSAVLDDLPAAVAAMLREPGAGKKGRKAATPRGGQITPETYVRLLKTFDDQVQLVCREIQAEQNRLREKRREVRERIRPPWLSPLVGRVRSFLENLPESQYEQFLTRYEVSDEALGTWLDALASGVNLDDAEMTERLRRLENSPASILEEFGALRELIAEETFMDEETAQSPPTQLTFDTEPFVHRIEARVTNLRVNLPLPSM